MEVVKMKGLNLNTIISGILGGALLFGCGPNDNKDKKKSKKPSFNLTNNIEHNISSNPFVPGVLSNLDVVAVYSDGSDDKIHSVNLQTKKVKQLTSPSAGEIDAYAVIGSDNKTILFSRYLNPTDGWEVFVKDVTNPTSTSRQITLSNLNGIWACGSDFNDDMTKAVVSSDYWSRGERDLVLVDLTTGVVNALPNTTEAERNPQWVGNEIFYESDDGMSSNIYSIPETGGIPKRITNHSSDQFARQPRVSIDRTKLTYFFENWLDWERSIKEKDLVSGLEKTLIGPINISTLNYDNFNIVPDTQSLVYSGEDINGNQQLYLEDLNTGTIDPLTDNPNGLQDPVIGIIRGMDVGKLIKTN